MVDEPPITDLDWGCQYRIVSSEFPPIDFFEDLVEPDLMDDLFYIESLTNDRLRDEIGEIALVAADDRISGPGSSPVMAAFTHISKDTPSRFSDGTYGVYYAARTQETAIEETKFHRAKFLSYTNEDPGEIDMRVYIGEIAKPMHNIQNEKYSNLHNPDDWNPSQLFGQTLKEKNSWGIIYNSVRDPGGECIAALRPPCVTIPRQGPHLSYVWDGARIINIYEKRLIK